MIYLLKVFVLMLLSSKNDESDGIKTFVVYSSNEDTFSLASSVQEVHVIIK